ncbi:23S rRNA (uracil(1939)-C(5))-methyltransferase RlmD [Alkalibacter mobilis]|uniref:23S rRNA (uracil(1939)-C(5))-methyltransferase RlmD n=1 Tax=Alkalibacter mobilis TaxID=2787712 RepID=UPI00189E1D76|nr:23S rRNA (uracil(1939)-C(5))-methyltransferase RlmD [Alkalibacter mobilis]MBF7095911.1 23S rRNA (uracil(1939)-C(5))-methyltransferase RlmD [Alkalibacter mobilis]
MEKNTFNRNSLVKLEIIDLTNTGEGIGKIEGFAVFVDGTVPGDMVKARLVIVKKNYAVGVVEKFYQLSEYRVDPPCQYFGECGGCQIQNIRYDRQLEIKRNIVVSALERIGGIEDAGELTQKTIGMENPYKYRNKAQYKLSPGGKIGFYRKKSHHVIPLQKCIIQIDPGEKLISGIERGIKDYKISIFDENTGAGFLKGIVHRVSQLTGEMMLILVVNKENVKGKNNVHKLPGFDSFVKKIIDENPEIKSLYINFNKGKNNRVMGFENELVYGKERIIDSIGEVEFSISPLSFFQINNKMTDAIYKTAKNFLDLTGSETVFDLYCGIGTIGLYLADKAKKVYGIEILSAAIEDAQNNARLNNIDNAEFMVGKSEEKILDLMDKGIKADSVVLDPPRKGCDQSLLETLIEANPERIVYVSCNPATLARDIKILSDSYKVQKIQPIDNFSHSMHVETVTLLVRK